MEAPNILLIGLKHSGKSSAGRLLAQELDVSFFDLDSEIVRIAGDHPDARSVYRHVGRDGFRELEARASDELAKCRGAVIAAGGGTIDNERAVDALVASSVTVFLDVPIDVLVGRVFRHGVPAFVDANRPEAHFREICARRRHACLARADWVLDAGGKSPIEIVDTVKTYVEESVIGW